MRARILALFLLATSAYGLVPLTGKMIDPSGAGLIPANSFVRFELRNCGANRPRILGIGDMVKTTLDFRPDASGNISGSIYGNNEIDCAGSRPTEWAVTYFYNGAPSGVTKTYTIVGAFDLTTATANTVAPVVSSPTGDSTYLRLDGGNSGSAANPFSFGSQFLDTLTTNQLAFGAAGHRTTLNLPAPAANVTLSFPITTDTLVGQATADTLTSKTLTAPFINGGVITSATINSSTLSSPSTVGVDTGGETLVNKTLTAPSGGGNSVTLLNQQGAKTAFTGNGVAQVIYSYALPANVVQAGRGFRVTVGLTHSAGAAAVTYELVLGANLLGTVSSSSTAASSLTTDVFSVTSTTITGLNVNGMGAFSSWVGPLSSSVGLNFAAPQTLFLDFIVANTDQVTPQFWMVELIQ